MLPLGHLQPVLPWHRPSASGNAFLPALEGLYGALCDTGTSGTLVLLVLDEFWIGTLLKLCTNSNVHIIQKSIIGELINWEALDSFEEACINICKTCVILCADRIRLIVLFVKYINTFLLKMLEPLMKKTKVYRVSHFGCPFKRKGSIT